MNVRTHRYTLQPRDRRLPPRQGTLLKVEWSPGNYGYSDLHPWPEFGEAPLVKHLASIDAASFTDLVTYALEFSLHDHDLRKMGRNAFLGLILPRSHRLVFDLSSITPKLLEKWQGEGFTHVKVKIAGDLAKAALQLEKLSAATALKWRLDLNGRYSEREFAQWWKKLGLAVRNQTDFVEDPCAETDGAPPCPLASDWLMYQSARVRIVKPARERLEKPYARVVFSHSLDHPLGQAAALWSAARHYRNQPQQLEVCGVAAGDWYESEAFSCQWNCTGPVMKPTPGTGFGFDTLLQGLTWI